MTAEEAQDEQSPNWIRRRYDPCACDAVRGEYTPGCSCWEDEDGPSHGGNEAERLEWEPGYPRAS
jgi:hypothetical protein